MILPLFHLEQSYHLTSFLAIGKGNLYENLPPNYFRLPGHTGTDGIENTVEVDAQSCVHDYDGQLCPFNWSVGLDGDTCIAAKTYTGSCEPIWHGMSRMSAKDKEDIAEKCQARWLCVNEMAESKEDVPFAANARNQPQPFPVDKRRSPTNTGYHPVSGPVRYGGGVVVPDPNFF